MRCCNGGGVAGSIWLTGDSVGQLRYCCRGSMWFGCDWRWREMIVAEFGRSGSGGWGALRRAGLGTIWWGMNYEVIIHISLCSSRLDALWILLAVIYVSFEVCDRCFMILPVVFGICGFSVMSTWLIRVVTCWLYGFQDVICCCNIS